MQAAPATHQAVDDNFHVLQNDVAITFDVLYNDHYDGVNGVQISSVKGMRRFCHSGAGATAADFR